MNVCMFIYVIFDMLCMISLTGDLEKYRTRLHIVLLYISIIFKIFSWRFHTKLSKINRMNIQ